MFTMNLQGMERFAPLAKVKTRYTPSRFTLDGYRVAKNLGLVRGITVRSRSIIGNIGAGFQTIFGGRISLYQELCEKAREEAFEIMLLHAQELGANAILGMRYDANEVSAGITEVLAYGTAVVVEKV